MNYATLSQAICDWLSKDDIDRVLPTIIRFAQRDLEDNLRIRAMEYSPANAVLAAGTGSIAVPSDYIELMNLTLLDGNTRYPVRMRTDVKELHEIQSDITGTGVPTIIARIGETFYFDCLTDIAYTRTWNYYRRLPVLVASAAGTPPGNSNWWSENAEEAFLMSCLNKASMYLTGISEGDKKKWADAAEASRERLKLSDNKEKTSGVVVRSQRWSL